jgi:hypothetical protein
MINQRTIERYEWRYSFPAPTADYSQDALGVRHPALLDATGVDGRVRGKLRSFPGFRRLGISDGVLMVGPGVTHLAADGETHEWKFWKPELLRWNNYGTPVDSRTDAGVTFFKYVEFQKDKTTGKKVSGFVICLPYSGPTGGTANPGLPAGTNHTHPRLFLIYWDQDDITVNSNTLGSGWRCRILTGMNNGTSNTAPVPTVYLERLGVSHFGTSVYFVSNKLLHFMSGPSDTSWGCDPVTDGSGDRVTSEAVVLFWGEDAGASGYSYPIFRQMSSEVDLVNDRPTIVGDVYDTATLGTVGAGLITARNSLFFSTLEPDDAGNYEKVVTAFEVGVTFRDSRTSRRSQMVWVTRKEYAWALTGTGIDTAKRFAYILNVAVPIEFWDKYRFDTIEVWRSIPGDGDTDGAFYLEQSLYVPDKPAFDNSYTRSTSTVLESSAAADRHFLFALAWEGTTAGQVSALLAAMNANAFGGGRTTALTEAIGSPGFTYKRLMLQEAFDGIYEWQAPPPDEATRIEVANGQSVVISAVQPLGKATAKPNIQWTSPVLSRPENFLDGSDSWTPDNDIGELFGFAPLGQYVFALGTKNILVGAKVGEYMSWTTVGSSLAPISARAFCTGAGRLWVLTSKGLFAVDPSAPSIQEIRLLNDILENDYDWGSSNYTSYEWAGESISMVFDEVGGCLFIQNVVRQECLCYWAETGSVTRLVDMPWMWATQGDITVNRGVHNPSYELSVLNDKTTHTGNRAYFIQPYESWLARSNTNFDEEMLDYYSPDTGDVADYEEDSLQLDREDKSCYLDIYFPDFGAAEVWTDEGPMFLRRSLGMNGEMLDAWTGTTSANYVSRNNILTRGTISTLGTINGQPYLTIAGTFTAAQVEAIRKVWTGGTLYIINSLGQMTRRTVRTVYLAGVSSCRVVMNDGTPPAISGVNTYLFAPVVFRPVLSFLQAPDGDDATDIGLQKQVVAGSFDVDFIAIRRTANNLASTSAVTNDLRLVSESHPTDATATIITPVAYGRDRSPISDADSYSDGHSEVDPAQYDSALTLKSPTQMADRYLRSRVKETVRGVTQATREGVPLVRGDNAFGLRAAGLDVALGLESFLSGVALELRSMRVIGSIRPTSSNPG